MAAAIENLLSILDLEPLEHNLFRGKSPEDGWQRVFGGQVLAQALVAATQTVEPDRKAHSLHAYFLRPGEPGIPIIYEVDRIRDGRSFVTRRVVAIQHGHAIFSTSVSFQVEEPGLDHQMPAPEVPPPEELMAEEVLKKQFLESTNEPAKRYWRRERPIELRPSASAILSAARSSSRCSTSGSATGPLPDDRPSTRRCSYASDLMLLDTSLYPHARTLFDKDMQVASLDHALWFHRPFRADDWLLYQQDSPTASGGRGFNRGAIYTRDGVHIASVAQEGLIRVWPEQN